MPEEPFSEESANSRSVKQAGEGVFSARAAGLFTDFLEIGEKEAGQRFLNFVKMEYEQYGKIFGMYNLETTENVVDCARA